MSNIDFQEGIISELMLDAHTIKKPGKNIAYYQDNYRLWGDKLATKKRHGIKGVEIQSKKALEYGNRWGGNTRMPEPDNEF